MSKKSFSHLSDTDNPYFESDDRQSSFNVDIDSGYTDTIRYMVNSFFGVGNQRKLSSVLTENGLDAENVVRLSWYDFLVTFHSVEFPYCVRYHGRNVIQSGILTAKQANEILENANWHDVHGVNRFDIALQTNGVNVTIKIVKLARGKLNETMTDGTPRKHVAKQYRRNRKSSW